MARALGRHMLWGLPVDAVGSAIADEDAVCLLRMAAGDEAGLDALYARHAQAIFSYLLQLTGDRSLAEERLQDALVAAWKAAGSFAGRSSVRTWLFAIARRQTRDQARRHTLDSDGDDALPTLADPAGGPEDLALATAEREELALLIGRLNPLQREVLDLIFVHQLSYSEAAQVLEVPLGTVKSRLSNAKYALHRLLQQQTTVQ